eukprot:g16973.t1
MTLGEEVHELMERYHNPTPDEVPATANDIANFVEGPRFTHEQQMNQGEHHKGSLLLTWAMMLMLTESIHNVLRKLPRVEELFLAMCNGLYLVVDPIVAIAYDGYYGVLSGLHSTKAAQRFGQQFKARWTSLKMTVRVLSRKVEQFPELLKAYVGAKNMIGNVMRATWAEKLIQIPEVWPRWIQCEKMPYLIGGKILDKLQFFENRIRGIGSMAEIDYAMQIFREGWTIDGRAYFLKFLRKCPSVEDDKSLPQYFKDVLLHLKISTLPQHLRDCLACVMTAFHDIAPKVYTFINTKLSHHQRILDLMTESVNITLTVEHVDNALVIWKTYWLVVNSYLGPPADVSETLPTPEVYMADPSKFKSWATTPEAIGLAVPPEPFKWDLRKSTPEELKGEALGKDVENITKSFLGVAGKTYASVPTSVGLGIHTVQLDKIKHEITAAGVKIGEKKHVACSFPAATSRHHSLHNDKGHIKGTRRLVGDVEADLNNKMQALSVQYGERLENMKKLHTENVRATKNSHTRSKKHLKRLVSDTTQAMQNRAELEKIEADYEAKKKEVEAEQLAAVTDFKKKIQQCSTGKQATHADVVLVSDTENKYENGVPVPLSGLLLDVGHYTDLFTCKPLSDKTAQTIYGRYANILPIELPGHLKIFDKQSRIIREEKLCVRWKAGGINDDAKYETKIINIVYGRGCGYAWGDGFRPLFLPQVCDYHEYKMEIKLKVVKPVKGEEKASSSSSGGDNQGPENKKRKLCLMGQLLEEANQVEAAQKGNKKGGKKVK